MALLNINERQPEVKQFALFELGFRPMFLLAGLSAVVLMSLWLLMWSNWMARPPYYPGNWWHVHEMLLGYTTVVIVGFLLTASRNWTGVQTLHGNWLAALSGLWLLARILPFTPAAGIWIAVVDLAFLLFSGIAVAIPVLRVKQYKNMIFTPIVLGLWIANLLMHLQLLGAASGTAIIGERMALALITLLIMVMGTRVIPFFIEMGTGQQGATRNYPRLEIAGSVVTSAWALYYTFFGIDMISGIAALAAAALLGIRAAGWHIRALWRVPLLWILYLGFWWIPVALLLYFMTAIGWTSASYAIHALTSGAIGIITLGMMSRVILGHTGRELKHTKMLLAAFLFILATPLFRLLPAIPAFAADYYSMIHMAGGFWFLAFLVFVIRYAVMLVKPRVDGRPG
ncbi:MAG: NnrS family protein [Pseudomonadota bacterium]